MADVADVVAHLHRFDSRVQRCFGAFHEETFLFGNLADGKGVGVVAMPASQFGAAIHGDDVALTQHVAIRDAVDNHVVDRQAEGGGKTGIPLERGNAMVIADELLSDLVDVVKRHAGFDQFGHFTQSLSNKQRTFSD